MALDDGTFLNLRIHNRQWTVLHVDAAGNIREPGEPVVIVRATAVRDNDTTQRVRLSSVGAYMTSPRKVYPPYNHWVIVVLPREEGDAVVFPRQRFTQ